MVLPIVVGQVVAQKYRVDRFIGKGGMGVVVAGFHLELDQPVAIKFLVSESGLESEGAERFRREARTAAKIHSRHAARVFDIGVLEERVPYMVMELLDGNDLEQELERRRVLPVEEAAGYLLQAIDAVAEAHSVGIVHRDLKPTNLFLALRPDGTRIAKVLDFGISKSFGSGQQREIALTRTAAFVGSPLYMSPEQMRSARDVDTRADVWSLGAILYVMVTGQLPHPGDSLTEVCLAVMNTSPRPLKDFVADVPDGLESILMKCLAKEPAQRYASVLELAEQLLPFAPQWQAVVERATRLLSGVPRAGSYPPPSLARPSNLRLGPHTPSQRLSAPARMADSTPRTVRITAWSRIARKYRENWHVSLIVCGALGLAVVSGLLLQRARHRPDTSSVAVQPSALTSPAPSARPIPAVSEVHAAVPATPVALDVKPTPSRAAPVRPATARPVERVAPRAIEPVPSSLRYTYSGGRR